MTFGLVIIEEHYIQNCSIKIHLGNFIIIGNIYDIIVIGTYPEMKISSFHEMGVYDIPAMTEHIASVNNNGKIVYIGHSMGVTGILIYASELVDHAKQHLRGVIGLAPAAFMHNNAFVKILRPITDFLALQLRVSVKIVN